MFFNLGRLYLELMYLLKGGSEFGKNDILMKVNTINFGEHVKYLWGYSTG